MDEFIANHAPYAHWWIFGAILLAGLNVPISIDALIVVSAMLAATVVPEHTHLLYLAVFVGCCFSAWIAYSIGRFLGPQLLKIKWFSKILPPRRMEKVRSFNQRYGLWTLIVGRFIPFGVRNCIFMTTGISKIPFTTFILRDLLACFIWSTTCFYIYFTLSQNYTALIGWVKTFNVAIFAVLAVTVIGLIWYKRRKKKPASQDEDS